MLIRMILLRTCDGGDDDPLLLLEIESCRNLGRADRFGHSDPFVILKIDGREVGRTCVVNDSVSPEWFEECFEFPPSHFDLQGACIKVEVWDMDITKVGSFLGCAVFSGADFKYSPEIQTITKNLVMDPEVANGVPKTPSSTIEKSLKQGLVSTDVVDTMKDTSHKGHNLADLVHLEEGKPDDSGSPHRFLALGRRESKGKAKWSKLRNTVAALSDSSSKLLQRYQQWYFRRSARGGKGDAAFARRCKIQFLTSNQRRYPSFFRNRLIQSSKS